MSLSRKIFYNTLAQSAGKVLAIAIGLVTLGLLTRFLEEQGFGQYSTVLAFMGFVAAIADLGLYMVVVRGISQKETDSERLLSNVLGLRLVTALLALLLGAAAAWLFPYEEIVKQTMLIAVIAFLFVPLNQALVAVFQKHLATHLNTFSELVGRALNFVLVYWFIAEGLGLPFFILALAAGNAAIFFLNLWFAKKYEKFSIKFDLSYWKKILVASWPLAFAVILNLAYFKGDTIILSLFKSSEAVGEYSLPYKVLEVLLAFPAMFVGLVMPVLSRHAFVNWEKFRNILQYSFDAILLIAFPMVISTLFFSTEIISLVSGKGIFASSPTILKILIFATATIYLGTLFGYAVVAVKKERTMVWGYLAAALIAIPLYLILIPRYSYYGAAVATLVVELVVATVAYLLVKSESGENINLRIFWRIIPGAAAIVLFYNFVSLPWFAELVAGLALYTLFLLIFKAVPVAFIRQILFLKQRSGQ